MPSSVLVGGMRMSVTTTSGGLGLHGRQQALQVTVGAHHLDAGPGGQDLAQALADDEAVLGQDDANHGPTIPPNLRGLALDSPPPGA